MLDLRASRDDRCSEQRERRGVTGTSLQLRLAPRDHGFGARLFKGAESISHESVRLGVHLPRHPADADALEPSDETSRSFVQLTEMCLSHRGDTITWSTTSSESM